jgi:hypothetical protein
MDTTTNNTTTKTIVFLSRGIDDERATVAWTLANAGVANGQDVTVFAVSAGVDVLRKGAGAAAQPEANIRTPSRSRRASHADRRVDATRLPSAGSTDLWYRGGSLGVREAVRGTHRGARRACRSR